MPPHKTMFNKMSPGKPGTKKPGNYDIGLDQGSLKDTMLEKVYTAVYPNSVLVCGACWNTCNIDTHIRATSAGGCANHRAIKHVWQCCRNHGEKQEPACHVLRGMIEEGYIHAHEIMAQGAGWNPAKDKLVANKEYPVRQSVIGKTLPDLKDTYLAANDGVTDEPYPDLVGNALSHAASARLEHVHVAKATDELVETYLEKKAANGPTDILPSVKNIVPKILPALAEIGEIVVIPKNAPKDAAERLTKHLQEMMDEYAAQKRQKTI